VGATICNPQEEEEGSGDAQCMDDGWMDGWMDGKTNMHIAQDYNTPELQHQLACSQSHG